MDPQERVYGPGSSYIMAPFAHAGPVGGRFNRPGTGVYYAARDAATAVAETSYHRARFMAWTREPALELDMRVLVARLDARLHDLRGLQSQLPGIYDPDSYESSQSLAARLRAAGSWGVAYDSVRRAGGQCVAVFRPRALSDCHQAAHLVYVWDGEESAEVYEKRVFAPGSKRPSRM
jgi:RES domain-containing protein